MDNYKEMYTELLRKLEEGSLVGIPEMICRLNQEVASDLAYAIDKVSCGVSTSNIRAIEVFAGLFEDVYTGYSSDVAYSMGALVGQLKLYNNYLSLFHNNALFDNELKQIEKKYTKMSMLLDLVYQNPGIQHKKLAEKLDVESNYLSELTKRLIEIDALEKERISKFSYYQLSVKARTYYKETHVPQVQKVEKPLEELNTHIVEWYSAREMEKRVDNKTKKKMLSCSQNSLSRYTGEDLKRWKVLNCEQDLMRG